MTIVRWEPLRELGSLQSEMNRLFNTMFEGPGQRAAQRWVPAMDLVEADDAFVLRADLPGVSQEDVSIEVDDQLLTVAGERKSDHQAREDGFYRLERAFGGFSRSLTLPKGVDAAAVTASFSQGVLEVRIPKPAEAKPRRIRIEATDDGRQDVIEQDEREPAGSAA